MGSTNHPQFTKVTIIYYCLNSLNVLLDKYFLKMYQSDKMYNTSVKHRSQPTVQDKYIY